MNKTVLIVSFVVVFLIGIYLYSKSKAQILAPQNGPIPDPLAGSSTSKVAAANKTTLQQIAGGLSTVKTTTDVIKSVAKNIGALVADKAQDIVTSSALKDLGTYASKQVAESAASNALAGGAGFEEAAAKSMDAVKDHLAQQVAGIASTSPEAAATVVQASIGVQLAAAAVPLAIIAWLAYSWGVFDPFDPHAGFQKMTLARDITGVGKKGDVIDWIPDSVYDAVMNSTPEQADQILASFFDQARYKIEAQQAAARQIEAINESATGIESSYIKDATDPSTSIGQQIYQQYAAAGGGWSEWGAQIIANDDIRQNNQRWVNYRDAHTITNAQELKQGIALKNYGNVNTQKN